MLMATLIVCETRFQRIPHNLLIMLPDRQDDTAGVCCACVTSCWGDDSGSNEAK